MSISPASHSQTALTNLKQRLNDFSLDDKLKDLLDQVDFSIAHCDFGSCVLPANNAVLLDPDLFQGSIPTSGAIESALFELANLSQKSEFGSLVNKIHTLDPDQFVNDYETIEYRSALICKRILQREIPPEQWENYPMIYTTKSFPLHYLLQQLSGHSQRIHEKYKNRFSPDQTYRGSWKMPVKEADKPILSQLLSLKIGMEDSETKFGQSASALYERLKRAVYANPKFAALIPNVQQIDQC